MLQCKKITKKEIEKMEKYFKKNSNDGCLGVVNTFLECQKMYIYNLYNVHKDMEIFNDEIQKKNLSKTERLQLLGPLKKIENELTKNKEYFRIVNEKLIEYFKKKAFKIKGINIEHIIEYYEEKL